jgi:hypothetical protein
MLCSLYAMIEKKTKLSATPFVKTLLSQNIFFFFFSILVYCDNGDPDPNFIVGSGSDPFKMLSTNQK